MRMQVKRDMSRADRRAWASARTVPDIGARTAQWLSGDLGHGGGGYDVPDEDLIPALIAVNNAGFATVGSQPGGVWEDEEGVLEQRAFADGFIDPEACEDFKAHLRAVGGLRILEGGIEMVLTRFNGESITIQPDHLIRSDYHSMFAGCSGAAVRAAQRSAYIAVVDWNFGRNDVLWPALESWAATQVAS